MKWFSLATTLCATLALLTACSATGSARSVSQALSPTMPIAAEAGPPVAPVGPLLADGQQSGHVLVWLSSTPAQPVAGNAQLDTFLTDDSGEPLNDAQVTYDTDMTNMSHGLYLVQAEPAGAGHYMGRVHFSMPGPWRVITIIERPGREPVKLRFEFRVNAK